MATILFLLLAACDFQQGMGPTPSESVATTDQNIITASASVPPVVTLPPTAALSTKTPTLTTVPRVTETPARNWIPPTPTIEDFRTPSQTPAPTLTATPGPTATPRPTLTPQPKATLKYRVRSWVTDGLRIRACPALACDVLDRVYPRTVLTVVDAARTVDDCTWYEIDATGEWVAERCAILGTEYIFLEETT